MNGFDDPDDFHESQHRIRRIISPFKRTSSPYRGRCPKTAMTHLNAISDVVSEIDDSVGDKSDFDEVFADAVIPEEETGSGGCAELEPDVA